jgi:hypothetical protein
MLANKLAAISCSFGLSATSQQYFFSQNKSATSNQSVVLFLSEQAISQQPNEQAAVLEMRITDREENCNFFTNVHACVGYKQRPHPYPSMYSTSAQG